LERRERQLASELYRLLVAPLGMDFSGAKHLLIVSDGALSYLPFESLIDPAGRYLLEKHTVVYSQSASASLMLRALAKQMPSPQGNLLALGDPVYDLASLAPIPYTRE